MRTRSAHLSDDLLVLVEKSEEVDAVGVGQSLDSSFETALSGPSPTIPRFASWLSATASKASSSVTCLSALSRDEPTQSSAATASTSIPAPLGRLDTSTALRAGGSSSKNSSYVAFISSKSLMSPR